MRIEFTRRGRLSTRVFVEVDASVKAAVRDMLTAQGDILREKAVAQSSFHAYPKYLTPGPYGYGEDRPAMPTAPWEVNVHTGDFRKGWRRYISFNADGGSVLVSNIVPYAGFFTGEPTRTMVGRAVLQAALGASVSEILVFNAQRFEKAYAVWRGGD